MIDAAPAGHGLGRVPGIGVVVAVHHQLGEKDQIGPRVLGAGRPLVDGAQIFFRPAQQPVHGHRRNFQCLHGIQPLPMACARLTSTAKCGRCLCGLLEPRAGARGLSQEILFRTTLLPGANLGSPEGPSQVHGQRKELSRSSPGAPGEFPPAFRGSSFRAAPGCGCPGSPS